MNFLDKMERKYGRYALSHLTMYIIVTYIAGYIIALAAPIMRQYLTLEPYYILHGQIWRLVSWILIPPSSLDIFTIIMLFFYYSIGTSLERAWGDFKYNVYIFSGILMTIIGSFLLYGILYAVNGYPSLMGTAFSTYYISLSIFLGFAISFPDMQVLQKSQVSLILYNYFPCFAVRVITCRKLRHTPPFDFRCGQRKVQQVFPFLINHYKNSVQNVVKIYSAFPGNMI